MAHPAVGWKTTSRLDVLLHALDNFTPELGVSMDALDEVIPVSELLGARDTVLEHLLHEHGTVPTLLSIGTASCSASANPPHGLTDLDTLCGSNTSGGANSKSAVMKLRAPHTTHTASSGECTSTGSG